MWREVYNQSILYEKDDRNSSYLTYAILLIRYPSGLFKMLEKDQSYMVSIHFFIEAIHAKSMYAKKQA